MSQILLQTEHWIAASLPGVFRFFADPRNLPLISPPGLGARLVTVRLVPPPPLANESLKGLAGVGSEIVVSLRWFPYLPQHDQWTARIIEFEWNRYFRDIQTKGPFKTFDHTHQFEAAERDGRPGTIVRDSVRYDIGFGPLGTLVNATVVRMQLAAIFRHRQRATENHLATAAGWRGTGWH
jgi:ligand-binding SRPBCC domain-containing protein